MSINYYLPYMYRDGDNYKEWGTIGLTEKLTDEQAMLIVDTLDQGEYFIPDQVGVDAMAYSRGGTDADHPWHEFVALTALDTQGVVYENYPGDYNSGPFTPDELVSAFQKAKAEGWKDISDADAAKFAAEALIAKIAGYPTYDETMATTDNDDTRQELHEEVKDTSSDVLDALILEARKIQRNHQESRSV